MILLPGLWCISWVLVAHTGCGWDCLQTFADVLLTLNSWYFVRCVSWFYAENRRRCYMSFDRKQCRKGDSTCSVHSCSYTFISCSNNSDFVYAVSLNTISSFQLCYQFCYQWWGGRITSCVNLFLLRNLFDRLVKLSGATFLSKSVYGISPLFVV